jgi:membrane glycosyltransferase
MQIWIGLMGYLCSPLWLIFLITGSFSAYFRMRFLTLSADPEDLGAAATSTHTGLLLALTLTLLFLPRFLGILTTLPRAKQFGGVFRLFVSALLENILSFFLAPVLMMFHTIFVLFTISGWQIKWTTQNRADTGLSFTHCLKLYGWLSVLGLSTYPIAVYYLGDVALWLLPILSGWVLAPLLAWITSGRRLGMALKSWGLFITPEEVNPPPELQGLDGEEDETTATSLLWVQALLIPYVQAVHLSLVRQGSSNNSEPAAQSPASALGERIMRDGPQSLNSQEKLRLLWDGETVFWLHQELWSRPGAQLHPSWSKLQADCGNSRLLSNYLTAK